MALTSRQQSAAAASTYYHDVDVGASISNGDLVVVYYCVDGTTAALPAAGDFDTHIGGTWTQSVDIDSGSATALGVFWAVASSFSQVLKVPAGDASIVAARVYPASGGTPALHAAVATNTATDTSLSTGTATATGACTALAVACKDSAGSETTSWSAFTERVDFVGPTPFVNMLSVADSAVGGAGSVSDTATSSGSADEMAAAVLLFDNITLTGTYGGTSDTPYVEPTLASTAVAGNLLIIGASKDASSTGLPSTPSGFSALLNVTANGNCVSIGYYKVAAGGEQSVKVPALGAVIAWLHEFQGWTGTCTLADTGSDNSGATNVTTQSSGTADATTTALAVCIFSKDSASGETATGVTNSFAIGFQAIGPSTVGGADAYKEITSGTGYETTITWSGAADQQAGQIAIFEDVGGGGGGGITSFRGLLGVGF